MSCNRSNEDIWNQISRNIKLSEEFIREYSDNLNWDYISAYQELSSEFMNEFKDKLNWELISSNQVLPYEFIVNNIDRLNLNSILEEQGMNELSENIIEYGLENKIFDIDKVIKYSIVSCDLLEKYSNEITNWNDVCKFQELTKDFIYKHIKDKKLNVEYVINYSIKPEDMKWFSEILKERYK